MFTKIRLLAGRLILGEFALLFVFLCGTQLCLATTIHVPRDQPTIQAGIETAEVGDTLTFWGRPYGPYQNWIPECLVFWFFEIVECDGSYADYWAAPETTYELVSLMNAAQTGSDVKCTGVVTDAMMCVVLTVYDVVWEPCPCEPSIWGDVNDDCNINSVDVVVMVNYVYLGNDMRVQLPLCPYEAGDVNCDGNVNPVDVVLYVNYVYLTNDLFCGDPCAP